MSALPRTECPWCGRSVPVRRNGALREHRIAQLRDLPACEGSGQRPVDYGNTSLSRAIAGVSEAAQHIADTYPPADYAGTSKRRADRNAEHVARETNGAAR